MSLTSILQIVKLENEKGTSKATKRAYDFIVAQCLLLDEFGAVQQTGRMMVPDSLRADVALDVYAAGFTLTVAGMGKRKGEVVPRLQSLTSMSSGAVALTKIPSCQTLQILKIDDLKTGISDSGREWSRLNCEVMLLDLVDGKYVPSDVGRIAIPEALREGLTVGAYSGVFALSVQTFGDEKEKHEVSARLTGLTRIPGGFKVGLPKPVPAARAASASAPAEPVKV